MTGLGLLTYALTSAGSGLNTVVLLSGAAGAVSLLAFVLVERRCEHPLVPPVLFRSRQFTAANLVTLLVYAPFSVIFVLLVLQLQVVSEYSPLLAGSALLPVTVILLRCSARVGALARRMGPRPLLTAGPLTSAGGVILISRIDGDADYLWDVLPGAVLFGAGLTLLVAPLTATVLDSAADRFAGVASGVNNAVARSAGLLAVAVVPVAAGISGIDYTDPVAFSAGFRAAMVICVALLVAAGGLAAALVRRPLDGGSGTGRGAGPGWAAPPARSCIRIETYRTCGVSGPAVNPGEYANAPGVGAR